MKIFAGRIRDVNKGYWMSFENHPRLLETKQSIYTRCVPCLEKLYAQLQSSSTELKLEEPLDCWKIVVVFDSLDECLELLCLYEEKPEDNKPEIEIVRGRIGTSDKSNPRVVIIFQVLEETERVALTADILKIAPRINPGYSLFYERGCGDPYGLLCGDWRKWKSITPIINPHMVSLARDKVEKLLRGDY